MNDACRKLLESVCISVEEVLKNPLPLNNSRVSAVRETLVNSASEACPFTVGDVNILWDTWTWKQKLYWFWKIKLGFGWMELRYRDDALSVIAEVLQINADGDLDKYNEIVRSTKKWWYEKHPKSVVCGTITVVPKDPIEYVETSFIVEKAIKETKT